MSGITDKCTHAFADNVDNLPLAVNAINLVRFEIEEESNGLFAEGLKLTVIVSQEAQDMSKNSTTSSELIV